MAVLLDSSKALFVHIPKNGGNTVHQYMKPLVQDGDMVVMEGVADPRWFGKTVSVEKHAPAWLWKVWFEETGRDWDEYKTFAVIRDPMLRPQSIYQEIKRSEERWARREAGEKWWDDFAACENVEDFVLRGLCTPEAPLSILRSQWESVTYSHEVVLDRLLLLETLWWQLPALFGSREKIGWYHPGQYVPAPLSIHARRVIARRYADDIALYDDTKARLTK